MSDLIDRQAVNDVFVKLQQDCFANGHLDEWFFLVQAAKEVNEIPSAEPERKKGEWLEYNATGKKQCMCSECGAEEKNPKVARFCYWCGADMRGEDNG